MGTFLLLQLISKTFLGDVNNKNKPLTNLIAWILWIILILFAHSCTQVVSCPKRFYGPHGSYGSYALILLYTMDPCALKVAPMSPILSQPLVAARSDKVDARSKQHSRLQRQCSRYQRNISYLKIHMKLFVLRFAKIQ